MARVAGSALLLVTCVLPDEPSGPSRVVFTFATDTLVVALRDSVAHGVAITVDGVAPSFTPRLTVVPLDAAQLNVDSTGRVVGLQRGLTGVRLTLISGAAGAHPVDTVLPVRVVLGDLLLTRPADTLTAIGDTLQPRPAYLDGNGVAVSAAESLAVAPLYTLLSAGAAVQLTSAGTAVVATAVGADTIRVQADTATADFIVVVRQVAATVRGLPDTARFIALTQTRFMAAQAADRRGHPIAAPTAIWQSLATGTATVSGDGAATAVANGTTAFIVTVDTASDTVPVIVSQVARQLAAAGGSGQLGTVGAALANPFVVQVSDSLGFPAAHAGVSVTFRVDSGGGSFGGAATIDATTDALGRASATHTLGTVAGVVNGVTAFGAGLAGTARFTATGGPAAAHRVVMDAGNLQAGGAGTPLADPLVVVVRDAFGNPVPNHPVSFVVMAGGGSLSGADSLLVISDAQGRASAHLVLGPLIGAGLHTVRAGFAGMTTPAAIFTADGLVPVRQVLVTPAADTVAEGATIALAAATLDSAGGTLTGRRIVWGSSDQAVATVDAAGLVRGEGAGTATIMASSDGVTGSALITVLGAATRVRVQPDSVTVRSLDTVRVTATLLDAADQPVAGSVTWASDNVTVATISPSGLITGQFDGGVWVRATSGSLRDSVWVAVTPIPVASVDAEPEPVTLFAIGETTQLVVTARDSTGALIPTARFGYASDNEVVAVVSGGGLITAVAPGAATVRVMSGLATDDVPVNVVSSAFSCSAAGTPHSGNVTASQTWLRSQSPHQVTGSVAVQNGATLTIEPGSLVCLASGVQIQMESGGRLEAVGGPGVDQIVFTATNPAFRWARLSFTGTASDSSRLKHARVEYTGSAAVEHIGGHLLALDSVHVRHANTQGLLLGTGARATRVVVDRASELSVGIAAVRLLANAIVDGLTVLSSGTAGIRVEGTGVRLRNTRITGSAQHGLLFVAGGALAEATNVRILGGGSYPAAGTLAQLAPLLDLPADSLLGNASDSIVVTAGTLTADTVTVSAATPLRVEGDVTVGAGGLLNLLPGVSVASGSGVDLGFIGGGRLRAIGTAAQRIRLTRLASAAAWGGLWFDGSPTDSSVIRHAVLEHGTNPASFNVSQFGLVASAGTHKVVLDSVQLRQASGVGAWLLGRHARVTGSVIDTTGSSGVVLGDSSQLRRTTIRYATGLGIDAPGNGVRISEAQVLQTREVAITLVFPGGGWTGIWAPGTLAEFSGVRVQGGGAYPIATGPANLGLILGQPVDSLLGNARDTLVVMGGTLRYGAVALRRALPWRLMSSVVFDSGAVVTAEPGAGVAAHAGARLTFQEASRLIARGTASEPVRFTAVDPATTWGGLLLAGRSGVFLGGIPRDTSWLTNAIVEFASQSGNASVDSRGKHVLLIDSTVIRRSGSHAVNLNSAFSRIQRSVIDTATGTGVTLGDTTFLDSVTVRRAQEGLLLAGLIPDARRVLVDSALGTGVRLAATNARLEAATVRGSGGTGIVLQSGTAALLGGSVSGASGFGMDLRAGTITQVAPFTVSGGASAPLYVSAEHYALLAPDSAARHRYTGNSHDTAQISGGTMRNTALVISNVHPMRFDASVVFDSGTVVTIRPGQIFRMVSAQSWTFRGNARLVARGTAVAPIEFVPANLANPWGTLAFQGTPPDTSYLVNARLFRGGSNGFMVAAAATHPLVVDSAQVRQSRNSGVQLLAPGSRFSRSVVDTTGRDNNGVLVTAGTGLDLGASTLAESSVVRGVGGIGVDVNGPGVRLRHSRILGSGLVGVDAFDGVLVDLAGTRVQGSGSYPLRGTIASMVATPGPDSLTGNGRDSISIVGGTATNAVVTAPAGLPWAVSSGVTISTGATMVMQPGAILAMGSTTQWTFLNGGRLVARGSAASPVRLTAVDPSVGWRGLNFQEAGADTSFLTNVVVEHVTQPFTTSGGTLNHAVDAVAHLLAIDSTVIRQGTRGGVRLGVAGSRMSRSRVDTVGLVTPQPAVSAAAGTVLDTVAVRGSQGLGFDLTGAPALVRGLVATLGASYPLQGAVAALAMVGPADQATLVGNARDSLVAAGGTLTNATLTVGPGLPWRVTATPTISTGATVAMQPGARLAMGATTQWTFINGGRLVARGSAASPVRLTAIDPVAGWRGLNFQEAGADTSFLTNAVVEHLTQPFTTVGGTLNHGVDALAHLLAIDSTVIRQGGRGAVRLGVAGSRLSRSRIDTVGLVTPQPAVSVAAGTILDTVAVRGSQGVGYDLTGVPALVRGIVATLGASYPLEGPIDALARVSPADQAQLVGNARDSLVATGGTLTNATLTVGQGIPWRVTGSGTISTGAVLAAQPGARLAMGATTQWTFINGGMLLARGTAANPVVLTAIDSAAGWRGLNLQEAGADTSFVTNARLEHMTRPFRTFGAALNFALDASAHLLAIDSSVIRQGGYGAVQLGAGSRLTRTRIDTVGLLSAQPAVRAGTGATLDSVAVRGSQGLGFELTAVPAAVRGLVATLGASYPLRAPLASLIALTATDVAALSGNVRDSLVSVGGLLSGVTATVQPALPWRIEGAITVDTNAVLALGPGAGIAFTSSVYLLFTRNGRLHARGSAAQPVTLGAVDPAAPWSGMQFSGRLAAGDSSFLTNAEVRHANGGFTGSLALYGEHAQHPVAIDSTVIRQIGQWGVLLQGAGSRLQRSRLDTIGTNATHYGVGLGPNTRMDSTTIRNAGVGVELRAGAIAHASQILDSRGSGVNVVGAGASLTASRVIGSAGTGVSVGGANLTLTGTKILNGGGIGLNAGTQVPGNAAGLRVSGNGSYGIRAPVQLLRQVPLDSLTGNARDTLVITGGTMTADTQTVRAGVPWRVEGHVFVDTQSVLVTEPGARLRMGPDVALVFQRDGRLVARGSASATVQLDAIDPAQAWSGLWFQGPLAAGDSSFLTNVVLQHASGAATGSLAVYGEHAQHPVAVDSTVIRQIGQWGVLLQGAGSRLQRSRLDTIGTNATHYGVGLAANTRMDSTTIRNAGVGIELRAGAVATGSQVLDSRGNGVNVTGAGASLTTSQVLGSAGTGVSVAGANLALTDTKILNSGGIGLNTGANVIGPATGLRVTSGGSYGIRAPVQLLSQVPLDSLTGNAWDTLVVVGGTMTADTQIVTAAVPWRIEGHLFVDTQAVLVVAPGARLQMGAAVALVFQKDGRLAARGTAAAPVVLGAINPAQRWSGLWFRGPLASGDSSFLTNAVVQHTDGSATGGLAVYGEDTQHPVVLDSAVIRQTSQWGVLLQGAGSRLTRSRIDTVGTGTQHYGVALTAGTRMDSTTVRNAGLGVELRANAIATGSQVLNSRGTGVQVSGAGASFTTGQIIGSLGTGVVLTAANASFSQTRILNSGGTGFDAGAQTLGNMTGLRVTGGASFGVRAQAALLAQVPLDSLVGNAVDTLLVTGGIVKAETLTVTTAVPWRLEGHLTVDSLSLLTIEPGVRLPMTSGVSITMQGEGRLHARGTAAAPITLTAVTPGQPWSGLVFLGPLPAGDTSFLTNVVLQHANGGVTGGLALNAEHALHPVVIDSAVIRQIGQWGLALQAPGSRITRSRVDTVGTTATHYGLFLAAGTRMDSTRVRNAGLGVAIQGAGVAITHSEISRNRSHGLNVTSGLSGVSVTGSNIFGNGGSGIVAGTGGSPVVTATGNWWGSAAGAPGSNGAVNVGNVDASLPAVALLVLAIPFP